MRERIQSFLPTELRKLDSNAWLPVNGYGVPLGHPKEESYDLREYLPIFGLRLESLTAENRQRLFTPRRAYKIRSPEVEMALLRFEKVLATARPYDEGSGSVFAFSRFPMKERVFT